MTIIGILFSLAGGLCLFLYGMKVMSDGVQQAAGNRMQQALNLMTRNRFVAVLTGAVVTALVQSSSATTVMLISFVNAGLLSFKSAIGVVMGANIGTTTTAWLVSLIGFTFDISILALPAIALGFITRVMRWKYQAWGEALLGFGFIFLGLQFLDESLPTVSPDSLEFIRRLSQMGFLSVLLSLGVGTVVTLLIHSSAAAITLIITLAFRQVIDYPMAAAMVLGANIGTTIDAIMAALGAKTAAQRTALVHVLFNVIGSILALAFFQPLLGLVNLLTPGLPEGPGIATHLAMFHSVFNVGSTILFLPFVDPLAALVTFLIKDKPGEQKGRGTYHFASGPQLYNVPEMGILRTIQEIRTLAGLVQDMYASFGTALSTFKEETPISQEGAAALAAELQDAERYGEEMREELSNFLIECSSHKLNHKTRENIALLIRIIADLKDMTDTCYGLGLLLERGIRKDRIFKQKEMKALAPYMALVDEFLGFLKSRLGDHLTAQEEVQAAELENRIDRSRNKLRKLGRKRIEAGRNVKTELLFIDLVRRIEKLGDYCYSISQSLADLR